MTNVPDIISRLVENFERDYNNVPLQTPHDKRMIQRQIDTTDKQIDNLAYDLYGLSELEIKVVEGM